MPSTSTIPANVRLCGAIAVAVISIMNVAVDDAEVGPAMLTVTELAEVITVGVPEMMPLDADKLRPVGKLPFATVNTNGVVPVAVGVKDTSTFTTSDMVEYG